MNTIYETQILIVDDNQDLLHLLCNSYPAQATSISKLPQIVQPQKLLS